MMGGAGPRMTLLTKLVSCGALVAAVQPGLLESIVQLVTVLGGLPLVLIAILALAAVYSRDQDRRTAAEKVLDRLLIALRRP